VISFSYWSIKPWFLTEGNLQLSSSYLPLGVSQQVLHHHWGHQAIFWRRCRGERGFLQGEFLTSNLFNLFLFCLVSFALFCLPLYLKNTKKLVPFIAVVLVALF
jgi:hypothetical protein